VYLKRYETHPPGFASWIGILDMSVHSGSGLSGKSLARGANAGRAAAVPSHERNFRLRIIPIHL
jgi:hypothetical protein